MALDSKGHPHIVYRDFGIAAAKLKYATWDGAAWHIEVVDSQIVDSPSRYFSEQNFSIAVDSADRPHISYMGGYSLKYAAWNGSNWQFQTVDTQAGMYELPNSLALDSADRPHIVYHDQYAVPTALKYAVWNGSAWQLDTVDSGNVPGLRNSLKLDAKNQPHIGYYVGINGEGGGALYYAKIGSVENLAAASR